MAAGLPPLLAEQGLLVLMVLEEKGWTRMRLEPKNLLLPLKMAVMVVIVQRGIPMRRMSMLKVLVVVAVTMTHLQLVHPPALTLTATRSFGYRNRSRCSSSRVGRGEAARAAVLGVPITTMMAATGKVMPIGTLHT